MFGRSHHRTGLHHLFGICGKSAGHRDTSLSAVTIVWNYVGELVFNLLVLVGAVKASDRIVKEIMGL